LYAGGRPDIVARGAERAGMSALKSAVAVNSVGPVAGLAWLTAAPNGLELHVVGKLTMQLVGEGQTALVPRPELPGHIGGLPAPEELDAAAVRRVIVRGTRPSPGRAILRRGSSILAEATFQAGSDAVVASMPSTMQTTIAGKRGDEWLVVEGGDGASSRRWCKLPKLGILATWSDVERLLLTSRLCVVDVRTWTVSFVLRASRKVPASMAPSTVSLSVQDLATNQVVSAAPATKPSVPSVASLEDDESTMSRGQDAEPKTRVVSNLAQNLPEQARRQPEPARPAPRPSSGGLRIGRTSSSAIQAVNPDLAATVQRAPIHDEPTTSVASPIEAAPSSVTRAFSALSNEGALLRAEVAKRIREGRSLQGLALQRAELAGIALPGVRLGGLDLSHADLRGADLTGADLTAARLDGAQLDGARLDGAELMMANLHGASLRNATVSDANFAGADLTDADVSGALPKAAFVGATLTHARR
jgi:hypothetical protein